jgi:hypothetical protein
MSERTPHPPEELESAMRHALDNNPTPTAFEALEAAEHLLDRVLRTDCESRESALDLLTVDALMTRALAIAAKDPNLLEEFPEQAMRRVASHVGEQS